MKKSIIAASALALALPVVVGAQNLGNVQDIVAGINVLVNTLLPIAFTAAVLFFFWGLATYLLAAGDEGAQDKGKRIMLWGVIALFVMSSIWGLVRFIQSAVGVNGNVNTVNVPGFQ